MSPAVAEPARRAFRLDGGALITAALVVASAAVALFHTRGFYFISDDFLNFVLARDMGLGWKLLDRDLFSQFVPLHRLGTYVYLQCFGLRFWPFRLLLAAFASTAILLAARVGRRRRVHILLLIPVLTVLAFSPVFLTCYQWLSAAMSVLPCAAASMGAICLAEKADPPGWRRKAGMGACYATGLLFYPIGLFLIVIVLGIRLYVGLRHAGLPWRAAMLRAGGDIWPMAIWVPAYAGVVVRGHYSLNVVRPDFAMLAEYVWRGWNHGFLAGVLGLGAPFFGNIAVANLLVLGAIGISVCRDWRNSILWASFFVYFFASIAVIGWNREGVFGVASADERRYYVDIFCVFVMLLFIAYGNQNGMARGRVAAWKLAAIVACSAGGAAYLIRAGALVPGLWYAGPALPAAFVGNVRVALAQAGAGAKIENTVVPNYVMPGWMWPLNQYAFVLPVFGWHGRVVAKADAAVSFGQDGRLHATVR